MLASVLIGWGVLELALFAFAFVSTRLGDEVLGAASLCVLALGATLTVAPTHRSAKVAGFVLLGILLAVLIGVLFDPAGSGETNSSTPSNMIVAVLLVAPAYVASLALQKEVGEARDARDWQKLLDDTARNPGSAIYRIVGESMAGQGTDLRLVKLFDDPTEANVIAYNVRGHPTVGSWIALAPSGDVIGLARGSAPQAHHVALGRMQGFAP